MAKKQENDSKLKQGVNEHNNEYENDFADALEQITPFIEVLAPNILEYHKIREPLIKRSQWMNFVVMVLILGSVFTLAFYGVIDGSAATGLIGAVVGYVFGGLYQQRTRS